MFNNATRTVVVHNAGLKRPAKSYGASLRDFVAVQENSKRTDLAEAKLAAQELRARQQALQENVTMTHVSATQIMNASNKVYHTGREELLIEALTDIYIEATPLDAEFVQEHLGAFRSEVTSFVQARGGFKLLESLAKTSPALGKLHAVIEKTAKEVSTRTRKDMKEDGAITLNFDMTSDEKDRHCKSMEDLSTDQIADLVKRKVIDVVKDEKNRQQKEDDVEADIKQKIEDAPEATKESVRATMAHLTKTVVKEATLFNALMHRNYKKALENAVASVTGNEDDDADDISNPEYYNTNADKDDMTENEYEGDLTAKDESKRHERTSDSLDMDLILVESIAEYTLMEMAHTMGLERYSHDSIKKLTNNLLHA